MILTYLWHIKLPVRNGGDDTTLSEEEFAEFKRLIRLKKVSAGRVVNLLIKKELKKDESTNNAM